VRVLVARQRQQPLLWVVPVQQQGICQSGICQCTPSPWPVCRLDRVDACTSGGASSHTVMNQ
jgi:hypothetical protein